MFFFCKPKTIVLDVFTDDCNLVNLLPPDYASNFKPKWWKDLEDNKSTIELNGIKVRNNTMRRCIGFKNYYSDSSIIIPLWSSFVLEYSETGSRSIFSDLTRTLEYQQEDQRGPNYLSEFHQFKLASPWQCKEKHGISFLYSQAFYNFKDPTAFVMPPAIIDFKYQHATEVNFFVRKPESGVNHRVSFDAGQPMIHLTPLTEKRVVIKKHVVTTSELHDLKAPRFFFNGSYNRVKKLGYGK